MDKRVDVETLRTDLDGVLAAAEDDRVVIRRDGRDAFVLTRADVPATNEFGTALDAIWADVATRGLLPLSLDEIDEGIAVCRREKQAEPGR